MIIKRRAVVLFLIIILISTLLVACSPDSVQSPAPSSSSTSAQKPSATSTGSAPAPSSTAAPAPQSGGPIMGQTIRTAAQSDAPSYDPMTGTTHRIQVHSLVWNGLIRTDPFKQQVSAQTVIPDLAKSWEISPDARTYTFYLREGVQFHDGKPFSATDVKYSLDKYRDPKRSAYAATVAAIESVDIVNDYTVKVNLEYANPDILAFLVPPYCSMLPEHLKDVDPKSTDFLVGTGPFVFKDYVPGKVSIYEKNPNYWDAPYPYLGRYEIYYLHVEAIADAFISGQLDTCGTVRDLLDGECTLINKVRTLAPEAVTYQQAGGGARGFYFSFKTPGPWNDVRVRQAMAMVIDYDEMELAASGGPELEFVPVAGLVPYVSSEALTVDEVTKFLGIDRTLNERITIAKHLMSEAGCAGGFKANLITRTGDTVVEPMCLYAMDIWKRYLNIEVSFSAMEQSIYYGVRNEGNFDIAADSLTSVTGTLAQEYLNVFVSGEIRNYGKWSNAEYDALIDTLARETDPAKRIGLAKQAQTIWFEDLPMIIGHGSVYGTGWRPDLMTGWPPVKGVVTQPLKTTYMSMDRIWFAETPDAARWMK